MTGCRLLWVCPFPCESCVAEKDPGSQKPDCSSWTLAISLPALNVDWGSPGLCLLWQIVSMLYTKDVDVN